MDKQTDLIITSDGKMGFKRADYIQHLGCEPGGFKTWWEIWLWTDQHSSAYIYQYNDKVSWQKALDELKEQLLNNHGH